MKPERFAALVERNQKLARSNPAGYRWRVAALALLGYAYMFGIAAIALLFSAGLAVLLALKPVLLLKLIKVIWAPVLFVWFMLKSLFMRVPPPEGEALTANEAPALFAEIERQRTSQQAARIHQVLVTDEFNAAIAQRPRFGLFGGSRNTLILGFRLMTAFSPEQFRAVLAHELGHLSGQHGYWGSRIYHLRRTWAQLQHQTAQQGGLSGWLVGKFLNWYAPYFDAYTFALARQQEYEADAAAARTVGVEAAASALVAVNVVSDWQGEHFWSPLIAGARREAAPAVNPFAEMLKRPALPSDAKQVEKTLGAAMREQTGIADTHPSLADRLEGLGAKPVLASLPTESAARFYLGAAAERFAELFGQQWQARNAEAWRESFETAEQERAELAALEHESAEQPLEPAQRFRLAVLIERERSDAAAALQVLQSILDEDPDHHRARFMRGRLRLEGNDARGLDDLDAVAKLDAEAIKPAAETAHRWLKQQGRDAEAEVWADRWRAQSDLEHAIEAERQQFTVKDDYLPAALDAEALEALSRVFERMQGLKKVWLVQKKLQHLQAERPAYLLIGKRSSWTYNATKKSAALQEALQQAINTLCAEASVPGLPRDITVVMDSETYKLLVGRVRKQVKDGPIWG